jgi:hypothetical protein
VNAVDPRTLARLGLFEQYRSTATTAWVAATGRSMEPTIVPGSSLRVAFGRDPERIGELILFRRGETIVAHRLVSRRSVRGEERLVAKGDGEAVADPPLAAADVLGVVLDVRDPSGNSHEVMPPSRRSRVVARVSGWSGRTAGAGVRLGRRMPYPLRRPAIATALSLSRVPTRLILAMIPGSTGEARRKGGETTDDI